MKGGFSVVILLLFWDPEEYALKLTAIEQAIFG